MPAGWESGVRLVEHYSGRDSNDEQTRGVFPSVVNADVTVGRVVRDREDQMTGLAAQDKSSITVHGTRPESTLTVDAKPEDMLLPLMAFFHNREYTVITEGDKDKNGDYISPYRETGTFKYAMMDAKPDITGAVVGTYDPSASDYESLVSISDLYTIAVEQLLGHGDLGDVNNGRKAYNLVVNSLGFSVQRGVDQDLELEVGGFGRHGAEDEDFAESTWGPGQNGEISDQGILTPDTMSLDVLSVDGTSVVSTWQDWLDAVTIEMVNGLAGRDPLGANEFGAVDVDGRPQVTGTITVPVVADDFILALKNGHDMALTLKFSNGTNEHVQIRLPLIRVSEDFSPNIDGPGSEIDHEIPFKAVVDEDVADPLVELEVETEFDVRTNSYFRSTTLADASTYTA